MKISGNLYLLSLWMPLLIFVHLQCKILDRLELADSSKPPVVRPVGRAVAVLPLPRLERPPILSPAQPDPGFIRR